MIYKILIADDDKMNLYIIANILRKYTDNYHIITAVNGLEAWELVVKEKPDLVLIDWEMPKMSGIEVIRKIKQTLELKHIPIIMETGLESSINLQEALDAGAMDYIRKPIDKIELIARVKSALLLHDSILETIYQQQKIENQIDELNKLSLIIKQTDNSVIIFNPDGDLEWVNEGFKKMYGYTKEEFINKFGDNIVESSYNSEIQLKISELFTKKKSVNYITHCRVKYGANKWIQTTLTPVFDGNDIEKFIAIESDISQQKKAEMELIKKHQEAQSLMESFQEANSLLEQQKKEIMAQKALIEDERRKTEDLLSNILPHHVAMQLKSIGFAKPRNYRKATVMFTDFKGFTKSCESLSPDEIVSALHSYFTEFDEIVGNHYIEKIKTIGDAYMCAGGVPLRNRSNPIDVVLAGLEIQNFMNKLDDIDKTGELPRWRLRVGIHTGALVAGVVGKIKFAYDIWGDTVNIAKRMESACEIGKVNISDSTYKYIKDYFDCEHRGMVKIKNRGEIDMYFVNGLKPEYAKDEKGIYPNDKFQSILNSL